MSAPLQKGDLAEIIQGAAGRSGPNIGKVVTVGVVMGEHSRFGRIVRVSGDNLTRLGQMGFERGDWADVPTAWLKKIEPPAGPVEQQSKELTA